MSFGYFEVEERCRKSFEAWQDKQQELEEKDKETLEAQNEREKRTFQEEDEKRQCWMRQFEVEKKHLEDLQKVRSFSPRAKSIATLGKALMSVG